MYYFISDKNFDSDTLDPRVPLSRLLDEDDKIKRICVSKSIMGCLSAINPSEEEILFVHTCNSNNVIQPLDNQVKDNIFTGEEWILEPVEMKYLMTIKIKNVLSINIDYLNLIVKTCDFDIINIKVR